MYWVLTFRCHITTSKQTSFPLSLATALALTFSPTLTDSVAFAHCTKKHQKPNLVGNKMILDYTFYSVVSKKRMFFVLTNNFLSVYIFSVYLSCFTSIIAILRNILFQKFIQHLQQAEKCEVYITTASSYNRCTLLDV